MHILQHRNFVGSSKSLKEEGPIGQVHTRPPTTHSRAGCETGGATCHTVAPSLFPFSCLASGTTGAGA